MKANKLLSKLSHLESLLNEYSYEDLSSGEGRELKKSFDSFKTCLEGKLFKPKSIRSHVRNKNHEDHVIVQKGIANKKASVNATMLIAKVSHEIRTPLNGIIGFTDLLKEEELTENQLKKVEAIQNASDTLMEIINELIEYSKLSEGLEQIEHVDFNLKSVIDNVTYLCNTLITDKNVVLKVDVEPGIPEIVKGDPGKVSQVLLNLLGNSIKFVEEGEIALKVKQKNQRNRKITLDFSVSDTGIGISEEHIDHIFESFKQAEKNTYTKYGGSGLGLSIVKQIIELLDGHIEVTSELGKGTTFNFQIPFEKGNKDNTMQNQTNSVESINSKNALDNMRILVFEDNPMNQKLIEHRLKFWGCKVVITDNGLYGLSYLAKNKVDLVLMDLRMPGMSGYEITEKIRNNQNNSISTIPVVAITADFTIAEKEMGNTVGLNDFILKPFSPEELLMKIINNSKKENALTKTANTKTSDMDKPEVSTKKVCLKTLQEDCMGEFDFLEELVRLFKQNVLEFIGAFSIHLKNSDVENLAFAAHKVKSGLAMVQANSLLAIVEKVRAHAKGNLFSSDEMEKLKVSFLKEYVLVEQAIDIEMEKVRKKK